MKIYDLIENKTFEGERPLFKSSFINLNNCSFTQGESALKFAQNIDAKDCDFSSKYLFWHDKNIKIEQCNFFDGARASIWYSDIISIDDCIVNAPKIFRDSSNIHIKNSRFDTNETLWDCKNIDIKNSIFKGDYLLFHSKEISLKDFVLDGNYSFQHTKNLVLHNVKIKSKDAFWNSENITIYDSVIQGEYLAWYSKNIKFVNCKIIGTQPLCYIDNLVLENCEMIDTDLAFEYTTINADVVSSIDSVKNPTSGVIKAKEIKELILDDENIENENLIIKTQMAG